MLRAEIWARVELENACAKLKHGMWQNTRESKQAQAIFEEFGEWTAAWLVNDINGTHGEIAEAIQIINLMARRIQFLTGESDA